MKNNYSRLKWVALIIIGGILFFLSKAANAATTTALPLQQQEVSGVVQDENGLPIPGVTITVKNTNRGTITNLDGEYTINAPANGILVFSYIGYKTKEVQIDEREEINIQLEEDIAALNEVEINAGYYSVTERERTGNISRVTASEIENQPVVSPLEALQGRMAGVEVSPGGSSPGSAFTIRIRGTNSLREEGNYPLYIIDGVPVNSTPVESNSLIGNVGIDPLNNLNIADIQSIEVLKDADATAIYGSRGANGVVLITTKNGMKKGHGVEVRVYTGAATMPEKLDLLNTREYIQIRKKAFENDEVEPTARNAYDLVLWDQERYTDWQDFLFGGTAETTNATITYSGGSENTSFRVGGSYFNQGTIYPGSYDYQKATGNVNLNHFSEDEKFNLDLSVNYGTDINKLVGNVAYNYTTALLPPNAPEVFIEDGSLNWEDWSAAGLDNPLEGYYNNSNTRTNNLLANLGVSYQISKELKAKVNAGYTHYAGSELLKRPSKSYNPADAEPNNSSHLESHRKSWIIEPQLIFNENFDDFHLETILGATFQDNTNDQLRLQGTGYVSEALIGNLDAAEDVINASTRSAKYRYAAVFARLALNWNKEFYLNLTGRRDGSSRFGPDNRFSNFGAVGTAWIFTENEFIKNNLSFISFGKLRGSFGTTGNDQIGDYGYLDAYEATPGPGGLYPVALANSKYSWEVNNKFEAAVELGLVNNRVQLGISWYRNRSSNQLVGYPLPAITGFNTINANLPATVENRGWEVEAASTNVSTKSFRWKTTFNLSFPKNELISYPNIEQSSYANSYKVGYPLNISLRYQYEGIDPETGFYSIADINGDGSYDYQDRVIIQDQTRDFFGGINNNLSLKGFSLQFLWEFVKQKGTATLFNAGSLGNQRDIVLEALESSDRFQRISQSIEANRAYNYMVNTNTPFQDASYLRLKTVSFSYNIPDGFMEKLGLQTGKIFLHGQNLITVTPYDGLDPGIPSAAAFVSLRTLTAGVQFNF